MSKELQVSNTIATLQAGISLWEGDKNLQEIKKLFAPTLTDLEFQFFVGLGKASGLNPFTREIWAVKYGKDKSGKDTPAQVFIGRDGYRKAAQSHPDYDYHLADAVYENDEFEMVNGALSHKYKLTKRGKLIGAYCIAKRHKSSKPHYVFVELDEYSTGQSLWAEPVWKDNSYGGKYKSGGKPATMIKKVAESQCLRACFQDLLGGTYGEEEFSKEEMERNKSMNTINSHGEVISNTERLKNDIKKRFEQNEEIIEACDIENIEGNNVATTPDSPNADHDASNAKTDTVKSKKVNNNEKNDKPATDDQIDLISGLLSESKDPERRDKAFRYFEITELKELTAGQAEKFIELLSKSVGT